MAKFFFTIAQLGRQQSLTPEGYLLCEAAPIARTGDMIYGASELANTDGEPVITPNDEGLIHIVRSESEVFRPETIASFNGKPITDEHPEDGYVSPASWRQKSIGVMLNVRRGDGTEDDCLLADLLINTPEGIEAVRSGKREISCGYDAEYEEISKGVGRQYNIIGNHVALVERGRCGRRCAIGDQKFNKEHQKMSSKKITWRDRVKTAFLAKDEAALNEALENEPADKTVDEPATGEGTHIHVHTEGTKGENEVPRTSKFTDADHEANIAQNATEHQEFRDRLEAIEEKLGLDEKTQMDAKEIEGELEEEAPVGTGDRARRATDSAYLADSYRDTIATAEILAPGIRIPTFDHKSPPSLTVKRLCGLRRQALDLAYTNPSTRPFIDDMTGGRGLQTTGMTCDAIRTMFKAVGSMKRLSNNDSNRGKGSVGPQYQGPTGAKHTINSVADINKVWEAQQAAKFTN